MNSQSGKGGVAYIMEVEHGMILPRRLQIEFSQAIQHVTEDTGTEISPEEMWEVFSREYLTPGTIELLDVETTSNGDHDKVIAQLLVDGSHLTVTGEGNGPISACLCGLNDALGTELDVVDYFRARRCRRSPGEGGRPTSKRRTRAVGRGGGLGSTRAFSTPVCGPSSPPSTGVVATSRPKSWRLLDRRRREVGGSGRFETSDLLGVSKGDPDVIEDRSRVGARAVGSSVKATSGGPPWGPRSLKRSMSTVISSVGSAVTASRS